MRVQMFQCLSDLPIAPDLKGAPVRRLPDHAN
jgi:hypothetical protein